MARQRSSFNILFYCFAALLVAFAGSMFIFSKDDLGTFVSSLRLIVSTAVFVVYLESGMKSFMTGRLKDVHFLLVGITLAWLSVAGFSLWTLLSDVSAYRSMFSIFMSYLILLAGLAHLAAPGFASKSRMVAGLILGILMVAVPYFTGPIN